MVGISALICVLLFSTVTGLDSDSGLHWHHEGAFGQDHWGETYSDCLRSHQSPIAIREADTDSDPASATFLWFSQYDTSPVTMNMHNKCNELIMEGTWESIDLTPSVNFKGTEYKFDSISFHWGTDEDDGSEHIFESKKSAMEIQLVHKSEEDEILVIAILVVICSVNWGSPGLSKIADELTHVRFANTNTSIPNFTLDEIVSLPDIWNDFYWYTGSLTKPPCTEKVEWCLGTSMSCITKQQIEEFRQLKTFNGTQMCNNIRRTQELNGRSVYYLRQKSLKSKCTSVRNERQIRLASFYATSMMLLFLAR